MILNEIKDIKKHTGTYIGVRFSKKTLTSIRKYIKDNNIPNGLPSKKLHSTVIYSRKYCPDMKPAGELDKSLVGIPLSFKIWTSSGDTKTNCLVLTYKCTDLIARHKQLMDDHNATFDFDEFTPHITLSYDVGDFDIDSLSDVSDIGDIEIIKEYHEDLDLNWAD